MPRVNLKTLFFPPLREQGGALYRARRQQIEIVKMAVVTAAGIAVIAFGQMYAMGSLYLAVGGFLGWRMWQERQRFGPGGPPVVRVSDDEALFVLPSPVMLRAERVPLRDVKAVTLQGDFWQRHVVFERKHGAPTRVTASYGRHDAAVVDYLRRSLPQRIPVTVQAQVTL